MMEVKLPATVWLGVLAVWLADDSRVSRAAAAETPAVAVNSDHSGWDILTRNGPSYTDVYGFNADGTSFPGWSGSYGALIGPGRWEIPVPGRPQDPPLGRGEGITDVSYSNGSLFVTTFMANLYQVNPRTGEPMAWIRVPSGPDYFEFYAYSQNPAGRPVPWMPTVLTRLPGYEEFLANPFVGVDSFKRDWMGHSYAPLVGPDGTLYMGFLMQWWSFAEPQWESGWSYEVLRSTGNPLDPAAPGWTTFIPEVPISLDFAFARPDMILTSDNRLLLGSPAGVLAYDATTGQYLNTLVMPGEGGLDHPTGLVQGNGDTLLVTSRGTDQILRYDARTGAFRGPLDLLNFQLLNEPLDIDFLDGSRDTLLVSQRQSPYLVRVSNVNGPGPATAEPFTPAYATLFGPEENHLSIAVIPEASPGGVFGWMGAALGIRLILRRSRSNAGA